MTEPWQYTAGEVEFYGCRLLVNRKVLIPRQETELLVEKIDKNLKMDQVTNKTLWDICCGSGCIGIALKKRFPELTVVLSDLSEAALEVAQENAHKNNVQVTFLHGDLFKPFTGKRADYITCNPPYVTKQEYLELDPEVRDYEPREALIGGKTGLEFYHRLADELPNFLQEQGEGKAWLEIGYNQGNSVKALFSEKIWKTRKVEQDLSGHDRFFSLARK